MQITVEQSATLTSATSGSQLRAVVQQKLRAFEDEVQFVVVSVFKSTSATSNASFEVTCRIGTRWGSQQEPFMAKGQVLCLRLKKRFVMF